MTPFIEEAERLLRLARRDYQTCAILRSHPEAQIAPIYFHAQKCVEKSLKAAMTANQVYFRYTDDVSDLTNLLTGAGIAPPFTAGELERLTPFAVEFRYDEGIPLLAREEADQMRPEHLPGRRRSWRSRSDDKLRHPDLESPRHMSCDLPCRPSASQEPWRFLRGRPKD